MEQKSRSVDGIGPGALGPGAAQDNNEYPKPLLEGATEFEYVVLLNPLPRDFVGQVAVTRTVNSPARIGTLSDGQPQTEADVERIYGIRQLRNPDVVGRQHILNYVTIPAGKSLRMFGNEAQIILRQLVDVVMSYEGKMVQKGDPFAKHEVETRLVVSRGSMMDVMNSQPVTVQEQMREALAKEEEHEFESVQGTQATAAGSPESGEPIKRGPGRPKGSGKKTL